MKTLFQTIIVALFAMAMSVPVEAVTGNKLLEYCENGADQSRSAHFQEDAYCIGFITGVVDGLRYFDFQNRFCLSEGVTQGQAQKVVIKYLKDNPQRLHEGYVPIIYSAIKEAFPCKETNSGK